MSATEEDQMNGVLNETGTFLDQRQVQMIDEALSSLGDYGVLRLVVEKGRLRFIVTQKSYDVHKWRLQALDEDEAD